MQSSSRNPLLRRRKELLPKGNNALLRESSFTSLCTFPLSLHTSFEISPLTTLSSSFTFSPTSPVRLLLLFRSNQKLSLLTMTTRKDLRRNVNVLPLLQPRKQSSNPSSQKEASRRSQVFRLRSKLVMQSKQQRSKLLQVNTLQSKTSRKSSRTWSDVLQTSNLWPRLWKVDHYVSLRCVVELNLPF